MSYALIPDGYSLKKVTKAQKQAVNDKRRHDDVLAILNNPTTVPILATTAATLLAGVAIDRFIETIDIPSSDEVKKAAKEAAIKSAFTITPQNLVLEAISSGLKIGGLDPSEVEKAEQRVRDIVPGL
jgi:hypothetical protein